MGGMYRAGEILAFPGGQGRSRRFSRAPAEAVDRGLGANPDYLSNSTLHHLQKGASDLKRIVDFFGMFVGGWVGWTLGALVSVFTAFLVGMVGTGVGLYLARRGSKRLLP